MINETVSFGGRQVSGLGECPIIRPEGIYFGGRKVIALDPGVGVGAMERANPLPPGRYWVDVFTPQELGFQIWLQRNKSNVVVTTTEQFDPIDGNPGRVWRLFEVKAPVKWEGPGFPTIAGSEVQSSDDTVQRPEKEKDPLDKLNDHNWSDDLAKAGKAILWIVGGVTVLIVGGVIITRYLPAPRPAPLPAPARI